MVRTKIICTLGPAADDPAIMRQLIESGMDVARMNFSHGTHAEHLERLTQFRALCAQADAHIPVLLDTKGPEIRLGDFPNGSVALSEGQQYILTTDNVPGSRTHASISYAGLPADVKPGAQILLDDGLVRLQVESVLEPDILCTVCNSGVIGSKKSINVPDISLRLPALTEEDKADILFAIANDYDYIAISFVRKKEDVLEISHFLEEHDGRSIKLIAKVENREGIDNLNEIIRVADGVMVARGDLGVEIPLEEIPIVQKDTIQRTRRAGKPVITATQMLDSMIRNPRPTRAEVTDIANAIFDGTSAIMLSGETASGKYPVEALQTMKRIAMTTERAIDYWGQFRQQAVSTNNSVTNAISHATCTTAMDLNAAAIVAVTTSGNTARKISSFRPSCPIIAATTNRKEFYQLRLSWGVFPVLVEVVKSTDDLFSAALGAARRAGAVEDGDLIVVTAGVPLGVSGTTNMLKVQMVGKILCRGCGIGTQQVTGTLCAFNCNAPEKSSFLRGNILLLHEITDETLPVIRTAAGVILDGEDREGKAATLAKTLEIPIITEVHGAMQILKPGTVVTLDAKSGLVKCVE